MPVQIDVYMTMPNAPVPAETRSDLMIGPFMERERCLVELLALSVKERAEQSGAAAELHDTRTVEATSRYQRDMRDETASYEQLREELISKLERTQGKLEERFKERYTEIDRAYQAERLGVIEKLNKEERAIDETLKEKTWLAETVFDSAEAKPRLLVERITRAVDNARQQATEIENEALRVVRSFVNPAEPDGPNPSVETLPEDPDQALVNIQSSLDEAREALAGLSRAWFLKMANGVMFLSPLVLLGTAFAAFLLTGRGSWEEPALAAAGAVVGLAVLIVGLRMLGARQMRSAFRPVREKLAQARAEAEAAQLQAEWKAKAETTELRDQMRSDTQVARDEHRTARAGVEARRKSDVAAVDHSYKPRLEAWREKFETDRDRIRVEGATRIDDLTSRHTATVTRMDAEQAELLAEISSTFRDETERIERVWFERMAAIGVAGDDMREASQTYFPAWTDDRWTAYHAPASATPAIQFGTMTADGSTFEGGLPEDPRLLDGIAGSYVLPAMLDFPGSCSLLIETGPDHRSEGISTLQNLMLRLLTSIPPGKLRFTILDPVGLGQSFAGFMHLADYEEALVSNRIWTDPKHIEQRLTDLTEHMEKVIQKYLRNEFDSIEAYNDAAGEIAEPYRFLVIADFPTSFTDAAAQRLKSILESGARCGVYTLILTDPAVKLPSTLSLEDIERHAVTVVETDDGLRLGDEVLTRLPLRLEAPPEDAFVTRIVHRVGELSKDAGRVEVPFRIIAPTPDKIWSLSCDDELRVPLGRAGATKQQYLTLGHGTSQHVLLAGKTGSGKSTLLHVLLASAAMWYSPREVEFYLVDFKKGVEFKTYATHHLAHARAVAVESDREFGLSVLHKLDNELKRRGDLYREVGAQDIAGFRKRKPDVHMPRTVLMIDEFQEFFTEDDKIAQDASLLLDRLVRQGRAFGMHVMLGSQTLSGAYSLARSTMGQMAVRIALQCSETDSYLILSEDNAAARLLARPGEAIYNDANGMIEGNSPFQIAWLPDTVRDAALSTVAERVARDGFVSPEPQIVFEGNVPAKIEENHEIARLAAYRPEIMPVSAQAWFGDAVAIKPPTAATFRRHTGSNAVLVGQQDDPTLALTIASIVSLAAQFPKNAAKFVILDGTPADDPRAGILEAVAGAVPHETRFGTWRDTEAVMAELGAELATREGGNLTDEAAVFLFIHGVHRFRGLRRKEDDFSFNMEDDGAEKTPDKHLAAILREGSALGMHVMLWADTVTNLERALDRQTIGEFDTRVLFQMNASDSTILIDSPAAGRLGMQRALVYNEESGEIEKFRPYAVPEMAWVREVLGRMV